MSRLHKLLFTHAILMLLILGAVIYSGPARSELLAQGLANHCTSTHSAPRSNCLAWLNGYMSASHFKCNASIVQVSVWYVKEYKMLIIQRPDLITAGMLRLPASHVMKRILRKRCK